ncbi:carbohydrate-binding domain-containing protein [bacterium]|nr:carbohydrate-binding domain-containing protein [bacterium]
MKKVLFLFLLILGLFIVSCGGSDGDNDSENGGDNGTSDSQTADSGSGSGNSSAICGNRAAEAGEVCDSENKACSLLDSGYTDGYAVCKADCSGWDKSSCTGTPVNPDPGDTGDSGDTGQADTGDTGSSDTSDSGDTVDNSDPRDDADGITYIHLKGNSIEVDGKNVTVAGTTATITASGVFEIDGTLSDGQILVNVDKEKDSEYVHVVFNGVSITNSKNSPFAVMGAKDVRIFTAKDTQNTLTDASTYVFAEAGATEPNAALYSKSDLRLAGEGTLIVKGNYNDGISSKDDLDIDGGTLIVNAKDDGIRGKDSVVIRGGNITVSSEGDGIKSDNTEKLELVAVQDDGTVINDAAYKDIKGYVKIKGGTLMVNSTKGDAIHAISFVEIIDGNIDITSGGGSVITTSSSGGGWGGGGPGSSAGQKYEGETSLKGIKASIPSSVDGYADLNTNIVYIKITGGTVKINSRDDAIHSGGLVYIKGGDIEIASDDDGIHADNELMILAGTVNVTMSYEGFEAWYITVSGGTTAVYGRDDGWNAAGGNDSSGSSGGGPGDWGGGGFPGGNGSTGYLTITGGFHYIKTGTGDVDGIDSNGTMTISGGVVVVECQISGGMGGSFDSDGTANVTTQAALGFSRSRSEKGTNYNMSFNSNTIYGNANIAFKPTTSGSYIQSFTGQPSVINDVSGYNVQPFPNGVEVYYK